MLWRLARRSSYGIAAYVAANLVLLVIEAIWHPIGHTAAWEIATLQSALR